MAASPVSSKPGSTKPSRMIDRFRLLVLAILAALFLACIAFAWITRDAMSSFSFLPSQSGSRASLRARKTIVDITPWQTAETLAALAVTSEENDFARNAERLADHEVDQAFASALRQATLLVAHRKLTGDALALSQRVQRIQELVEDDKALVQILTPSRNATVPAESEAPDDDDLDVAKAQLELDSDQLSDAQSELARAIGDNRADIQAELTSHEASMRKYDSEVNGTGEVAVISVSRHGTLAGRIEAWFKQNSRYQLLLQAQKRTNDDIAQLSGEHNALEQSARTAQTGITAANDRKTILTAMQEHRTRQQILSIYDDRIQTGQQLAAVYGKWAAQVQLQHRILLHLILQSLAIIFLILFFTVRGDAIVRRIMALPAIDRRQMHTLRMVFELAVQVIGGLLVLLVIFGAPQQTPTILGLVTAGITIVLQDFILAFFGWFFLMGKNGLRVGDWVEINGVAGEVSEVGLIYTKLLETGKIDDKGHPTGRRIAFINSFAIRGQYFNFTTTGQWMWDEIVVGVPASADPRVFLEKVQRVAVDETASDTQIAEQEWTEAVPGESSSRFSAAPVVNLRPVTGGTEILIRYMARASKRFDVRNRINQRVVDILREPVATD